MNEGMFVYSYILLSMVKTYGPKIGPLKKKIPLATVIEGKFTKEL